MLTKRRFDRYSRTEQGSEARRGHLAPCHFGRVRKGPGEAAKRAATGQNPGTVVVRQPRLNSIRSRDRAGNEGYDLTPEAVPTPSTLKSRDWRSRGGRRSSGTTALTRVASASHRIAP